MTDQVVEEVVANEQQDDSGFEDGFNEAMGNEPTAPPEKDEPPVETAEPAPEAPTQGGTTTLSDTETQSLLKRLEEMDRLKSTQDKFAGHIGTLKETIEKLKASQATGAPVEITDEDVKDIADDFPEFGGKMKALLQKVSGKFRGGSPAAEFDATPIREEFSTKLSESDQRAEARALWSVHRDWRNVVASDGFKLWMQTQPEDFRTKMENSWNAEEIADTIDSYKGHAKKQAATEQRSVETRQKKTSRLEAAVTPSGVKSPDTSAMDENAAFEAGFRSVRK